MGNPRQARFTAEQVATWLEEANGSRRAPWAHWPDATALAAELSEIDFTERHTSPHHIAVREVRRVTALLPKVADAFHDPTLPERAWKMLTLGAAAALSAAHPDHANRDWVDCQIARIKAMAMLFDDRPMFGNLLRLVAETAEYELAHEAAMGLGHTRADELRFLYGLATKTLERHTGTPASIRSTSPDARFVRDVVEHAGLPWRPRIWRRYGEEWAAVRRGEISDDLVSFATGFVPSALLRRARLLRTQSVPNGRQKKT